jgi:hypothetical protein
LKPLAARTTGSVVTPGAPRLALIEVDQALVLEALAVKVDGRLRHAHRVGEFIQRRSRPLLGPAADQHRVRG